jgi:hypothetical protein
MQPSSGCKASSVDAGDAFTCDFAAHEYFPERVRYGPNPGAWTIYFDVGPFKKKFQASAELPRAASRALLRPISSGVDARHASASETYRSKSK